MTLKVTGFFDDATNTISYVAADPEAGKCAIVDSVLDYDPDAGRTNYKSADAIVEYVKINGLAVEWILETHVHADHLSAAPYIKNKLGGKLAIGANITIVQDVFGKMFNAGADFARNGSQFDQLFSEGDTFQVGSIRGKVLHTPGHTPACVSYVIGDTVFVGDTLFMPDYGTARCDFPGGDAQQLYNSIQKIFALPDETRMFLCHDYKPEGRSEFVWETTVGEQRRSNVHVHEGVRSEEFVKLRKGRDSKLAVPKLILPSVQVNMRAGHMPLPEDNGVSYLKIPINVI